MKATCGAKRRPSLRSIAERNALVEENLGLVWRFAGLLRRSKLLRKRLTDEETIAAGYLGLIRAAELWEPKKGKISTYSYRWIKQFIMVEARNATVVHVPVYVQEALHSLEKERTTGKKIKRRKAMVKALKHGPDAMRAMFTSGLPGIDKEDEGEGRTGWIIAKPEPESKMLSVTPLRRALRKLPPDLAKILRRRYWDGWTLKQVGEETGLTRERIRQKQNDAIAKLRTILGKDFQYA